MWHGGTPATAISVWKTSPEQGRSARTHKILRELVALNGRLSAPYRINDLAVREPESKPPSAAFTKSGYWKGVRGWRLISSQARFLAKAFL
jgi:hypothetical protein